MFELLSTNSSQINTSLVYEKDILEELFQNANITNSLKEQLEDLQKCSDEVKIVRRDVHKSILNIERQYSHETNADIGIIYSFKQRNLLFKMLKIFSTISKEHKINIICFRIGDVNIENDCVKGIFISNNDVKDTISKLPPLMYNIGHYTLQSNMKKIKHLRASQKINLINPINRFNQYVIFDIILALYKEKTVLLDYVIFTEANLYSFLEKYNSVYLFFEKTNDKRKAIIIQRKEKGYDVYIGVNKIFIKNGLYEYILKAVQNKKTFIMKAPNTININNIPLETRVYVQKGKYGYWEVTEMLAKCQWFYEDSIYKDASYSLNEVLRMLIPSKSAEIQHKLKEDALKISSYLEYYLNNIGSCVLDFIITQEGYNYLIYCGGWEDKDFLLKLESQDSWKQYFENTISYLIYLRNSKVIDNGE